MPGPVNLVNVGNVVSYHSPTQDQFDRISLVRSSCRSMIEVILKNSTACADQSAAIRHVREAMMTANAAIVLDGLV